MDRITLIVVSLVLGGRALYSGTASAALRDAYAALRASVLARLKDLPNHELLVIEHEVDPETWHLPMRKALRQAAADQDPKVVAAARRVMELVAPPPPSRRFTGLLPQRMLRYRRPRGWQEVAIIAFGYWVYTLLRDGIPERASIALRHGFSIEHLQHSIGLNWDLSINRYVAAHEWLAQTMDYFYATLHFIVTPTLLVWLYIRRPHIYRGARTVLVAISLIALLGFYLYPAAPPRLLPDTGYIDTIINFHTWGSLADPNIVKESNQFAAMPSLHVGWALWCGIVIFVCARHLWLRMVGVLYPIASAAVGLGTANDTVLGGIAAIVVVVIAFATQYLLSGHGAFEAPLDAPDVGPLRPHKGPPDGRDVGGSASRPDASGDTHSDGDAIGSLRELALVGARYEASAHAEESAADLIREYLGSPQTVMKRLPPGGSGSSFGGVPELPHRPSRASSLLSGAGRLLAIHPSGSRPHRVPVDVRAVDRLVRIGSGTGSAARRRP